MLIVALAVGLAGNPPASAVSAISVVGTTSPQGDRLSWATPKVNSDDARVTNTTQADGAATVITLKDSVAPTRYDFKLDLPPGASAQLLDDGSAVVRDSLHKALGSFQPPWAKDASGAAIPTSYSLAGNVLSQVIDVRGATFPVTADPHYTWGWVSGTVYFNKSETKAIALGGTVVSWIPTPYTVIGGRTLIAWAGIAVAANRCIKLKVGLTYYINSIAYYSGNEGDGYCR